MAVNNSGTQLFAGQRSMQIMTIRISMAQIAPDRGAENPLKDVRDRIAAAARGV